MSISYHASERMKQRHISKDEIARAIARGKYDGNNKYTLYNLVVVAQCNSFGDVHVVTVYRP